MSPSCIEIYVLTKTMKFACNMQLISGGNI